MQLIWPDPPSCGLAEEGAVMTATPSDVTARKKRPEPSAEEQAARWPAPTGVLWSGGAVGAVQVPA